jgi:hypothetical protein
MLQTFRGSCCLIIRVEVDRLVNFCMNDRSALISASYSMGTEERCFLFDPCEAALMNGVFRQSVPKSYKGKDFLVSGSFCEETVCLNGA